MIAKVAVSAANFAIDKPYSYFIPRGMALQSGMRVIVPFGRGNRLCEGVVLSVEPHREEALKSIETVLDEVPLVDETMLRLTNMIRDSIRPDVTMFTECTVEAMEGKAVVVLTVQRGTARPYYLAGKGIRPEGVYVRQSASSVPASETAILNMIKETSGDRYEDARSINQQLTFEKAESYFAKRNLPRKIHISDE